MVRRRKDGREGDMVGGRVSEESSSSSLSMGWQEVKGDIRR